VPGDHPRFSPGCAHLALSHAEGIWVVPLTAEACAGGEPTRLTGDLGAWDRHPCWSPDGRSIAFDREAYASADREPRLMVMQADGNGLREFGPGSDPDWLRCAQEIRELPHDRRTQQGKGRRC